MATILQPSGVWCPNQEALAFVVDPDCAALQTAPTGSPAPGRLIPETGVFVRLAITRPRSRRWSSNVGTNWREAGLVVVSSVVTFIAVVGRPGSAVALETKGDVSVLMKSHLDSSLLKGVIRSSTYHLYTRMMRAAVTTEYGPPEVVSIRDLEPPIPSDDELLIKVHATTVNRTDCGYRGGKPFLVRFFSGLRRPKSPVLGTEFAGVVEALGTTVNSFMVGDRICGWAEGTFGTHAEHMTIRADRPLNCKIPEGVAFEEAAPSTEGSHYALSFFRRAEVEAGQDVMIYGATGAIGSAAVQIAKELGLRVTAVCGTGYVDLVRDLGADRVIDYMTEDYTSDPWRYDLIVDAVGKSSFWKCRNLLKPKGIYTASDRPWSQKPGLFIPVFIGWLIVAGVTRLLGGRRQMFVVPHNDPEGLQWLKEQIESGAFQPVIDRNYPLDQIVEAYRYVETGQKIGNVVIKV